MVVLIPKVQALDVGQQMQDTQPIVWSPGKGIARQTQKFQVRTSLPQLLQEFKRRHRIVTQHQVLQIGYILLHVLYVQRVDQIVGQVQ